MDGFGFGLTYPSCEICGSLIGDWQAHQRFHDGIGFIYQKVMGLSDKEYDKLAAVPAAERNRRLAAAAEALGIKVPGADTAEKANQA